MAEDARPVVLVTGGGRGIGAATARLAAARGYAVCVNYRSDAASARGVADAIVSAGGRAIAVGADVARESDVIAMFDAATQALGPVAALVNNAGILERHARLDEMEVGRFERVLATNVTGVLLCAREAVRRMSTRHGGRGGSIVNVSSMAARLGSPGEYVDYAASKGAVDSLTVGLAREVAGEGIRVNAVRPGMIYTDIHCEPGRVDRLKAAVPMKRGGAPEEVARAILWLLSDESSYCTGAFIDVSGGR
ncbi:MAG TPA: SDR family oxidoreductase [Usitatibacter sp.]|nr:SDR family oxidoreductase [Usitatibacter sp.]